MSTEDLTQLERVVERVVGEAAYIYVERANVPSTNVDPTISGSIGFSGPAYGRIELTMSTALAAEAASNMLAEDPSTPDDPRAAANGRLAALEVTNILAGALLAELFGTDVVFHLGLPSIVDGTGEPGTISLRFTDGAGRPLTVCLSIAGGES